MGKKDWSKGVTVTVIPDITIEFFPGDKTFADVNLIKAFGRTDYVYMKDIAPCAYDSVNDRLKVAIEEAIAADIGDDWTRALGQVDIARILGAAPAAANPLATRLSDGSAYYDARARTWNLGDSDVPDLKDKPGRQLGIIYGDVGQLAQRAVSKDAYVQLRHGAAEIDPRSIRALTSTDKIGILANTVKDGSGTFYHPLCDGDGHLQVDVVDPIESSKVKIGDTVLLSDWRHTSDLTKIDGADLYTGSVPVSALSPLSHSRAHQYYATTWQSIPNATWTKVILNTEDYDVLGEFDPLTNYRFTALNAGYYFALGQITYTGPPANTLMVLSIYKNGSAFTRVSLSSPNATNEFAFFSSDVIPLSVGDYLELWTYHLAGSDQSIACAIPYSTFLTVHRIP
jgi:hypothetical protein